MNKRSILILALGLGLSGLGHAEPPRPDDTGSAMQTHQSTAESGDAAARAALVVELAGSPYTREREKQAGYWLRQMLVDGQEAELVEVWDQVQGLRAQIAKQNGFKAPPEGASVGLKMFGRKQVKPQKAVAVLIREAELLNVDAQLFLEMLYERPVEGFAEHDPAILDYFQRMAREALPRARFYLGKIMLFGMGVDANQQAGQDLLLLSGMADGLLELAQYSMLVKEPQQAATWWLKAAEEHDSPEAWYNLGLKSQGDGRGALAKRYFERSLKADPAYHASRLELARMYASGDLIAADAGQAFKLMEQVAMQADGPEKFVAIANLGIYYQRGIGVAPDPEQARLHLEAALANGVEGARAYLK